MEFISSAEQDISQVSKVNKWDILAVQHEK